MKKNKAQHLPLRVQLRLGLLLLLLLTAFQSSSAAAYSILAPDRLTLETWQYKYNRDPYFPYTTNSESAEQWAYGAGLNFDFHLISIENFQVYSRNWLHLGATERQVREAGWKWDQGVRLYNKVEVFYGHHSRHILDETSRDGTKYPVFDMYGMRLLIYERGQK